MESTGPITAGGLLNLAPDGRLADIPLAFPSVD